jgi:D-sedoheptulose 7-phosphate isomerase
MTVVGLTGNGGGKLAALCDILLDVPSSHTPIIQQGHICLYHYLCEIVEARLANG